MKFSACIEMLFQEVEFIERIYQAKRAGFEAVEFWLWQNKELDAIKNALAETGMEIGIFQGNTEGRMIDPADNEKYVDGVKKSIETAKQLGAKHLFLMSDILKSDRTVLEPEYVITADEKIKSVKNVLNALKPLAEASGITLFIEPLNIYVDHKGYYLDHSKPAFELVKEINSPNIRVLYDIYHMQIMEGNIIQTIKDNIDLIGYIHVADVPGRNEPGTGEINYKNIYKTLHNLGFEKNVGFEFSPTIDTVSSLKEAKEIFQF
jgi:hydroxypyruvate isomerase